jgi:hypothetical protein
VLPTTETKQASICKETAGNGYVSLWYNTSSHEESNISFQTFDRFTEPYKFGTQQIYTGLTQEMWSHYSLFVLALTPCIALAFTDKKYSYFITSLKCNTFKCY